MRKSIYIAVALLCSGLIAASIYWHFLSRQVRPGKYKDFNILLITIDTLRADHLPSYGYTKIKTPGIDSLAKSAFIFEDAIAQTPMTLPSHATILTGMYPFRHGMRDNAGFFLDSQITTLPEILKQQNYKTAAFVSTFVLDSQFGLSQGFDHYSDNFTLAEGRVVNTDVQRRAEQTEVEIEAWLKQNHSQRFFLWAHFYDPHDPYEPPEPYKTEYSASPYDGEIAYTDSVVGKLLQSLTQYGIEEKTIVILTGDHGEGLGEHKEQTHSLFIYNATQHVPLMIRIPKRPGKRVPSVVSLTDIAPTILELAGIPNDASMQGASLIPLMNGKQTANRVAYSESMFPELHYGWSPLKGITSAGYKFIEAPKAELYDRKADRSESRNLIAEKPEIVAEMRKTLQEYSQQDRGSPAPQKMDPEAEEKLRALGYVGTIASSTEQSRKTDPKDRIEILEALTKAARAMELKNYPYVIQSMEWAVQQDPQIVDAHFLLASAHLHMGHKEKALEEMLKTVSIKPDHTQTLYNLALYNQLEGDIASSEHWYLQLLKYEPESLFGNLNLAALYLNSQRPAKAEPYLKRVYQSYDETIRVTADPASKAKLLEKVAEVYFKAGNLEKSQQSIQEAIALAPNRANLYFHLGNICRRKNDVRGAIDSFSKAIQVDSRFYSAYYALADTYYVAGTNLPEALKLAETAYAASPNPQGAALLKALRERTR